MRIDFRPRGEVADEVIARHHAQNMARGLPIIGQAAPKGTPLAVVGGAPGAKAFLDELWAWDGEIWAINGAYHWLRREGIEATFLSVSPTLTTVPHAKGARKAILGSLCAPELFDMLISAEIELADLGPDGMAGGTTTACTAPMIAAERGHSHVTMFGVESSFEDRTHAYDGSPVSETRLWVRCGGVEYMTTPQYYMQAECLTEVAREVPEYLTVRGDGLLPAMIRHGDWDVTHGSRQLVDAVTKRLAEREQLHPDWQMTEGLERQELKRPRYVDPKIWS